MAAPWIQSGGLAWPWQQQLQTTLANNNDAFNAANGNVQAKKTECEQSVEVNEVAVFQYAIVKLVAEAAEVTGVPAQILRQELATLSFKALRDGNRRLIKRSELLCLGHGTKKRIKEINLMQHTQAS